jgi:hypothetical protein
VLPLTPGGDVVAGLDRAGNPLTLRLFRPTATRAVLVGPTITAQLLALRALAAGAQIDVHTEFPQAWEPLLRGLGAAYWDSLRLTPAQARDAEPSAGRPHLVVRESPKTPADDHDESPWCAVLRVSAQPRPELFAGADLAMLHHLDSDDAAVAGDSLGIGTGAAWFSSIGPDMIGVWAGGRTVRWVLLSPTEVERHMISAGSGGPPGMR